MKVPGGLYSNSLEKGEFSATVRFVWGFTAKAWSSTVLMSLSLYGGAYVSMPAKERVHTCTQRGGCLNFQLLFSTMCGFKRVIIHKGNPQIALFLLPDVRLSSRHHFIFKRFRLRFLLVIMTFTDSAARQHVSGYEPIDS